PVEIDTRSLPVDRVPRRLHHTGYFVRIFATKTQQHQERTDLIRISLPPQHHPKRFARFFPRQRARTSWASPKSSNKLSECLMPRVHRGRVILGGCPDR